jgi:hypothetical protein
MNRWINFQGTYLDFVKRRLNEPGILVEVMLDNKKKQFLIGDMSVYGSVVGGPPLLLPETLLVRYQILWHRYKRGEF